MVGTRTPTYPSRGLVHFHIQVLALTHEKATAEETLPYLQHAFRPCPVLALCGRAAVLEPRCAKEECVYYAWRDRRVHLFLCLFVSHLVSFMLCVHSDVVEAHIVRVTTMSASHVRYMSIQITLPLTTPRFGVSCDLRRACRPSLFSRF